MERIAMAGFAHETKPFSPIFTNMDSFSKREGQLTGNIFPFQAYGASIENPESAVYKNLRQGVRLQGLGHAQQ